MRTTTRTLGHWSSRERAEHWSQGFSCDLYPWVSRGFFTSGWPQVNYTALGLHDTPKSVTASKAEAELPWIQKSQHHFCFTKACPHSKGGELDSTSLQGSNKVLEEREIVVAIFRYNTLPQLWNNWGNINMDCTTDDTELIMFSWV